MSTLDEFFKAAKEVRELREQLKVKERALKATRDGLSQEDRELIGSENGHVVTEVRTGRKQEEHKEKVRHALRSSKSAALTSKELRAETGLDANQMNNTLWQMREELEKVAANDKRPISQQNMAYRLKPKKGPKK